MYNEMPEEAPISFMDEKMGEACIYQHENTFSYASKKTAKKRQKTQNATIGAECSNLSQNMIALLIINNFEII